MCNRCCCFSPTKVSGIIFAIMAILHILRLILGWSLSFNGMEVGVIPSVLFILIASFLAIWNFKSCKCACCKKDKGDESCHIKPKNS